jgi:hypothetical protein
MSASWGWGIVSKHVDSFYRSGPSKMWLKSKNPTSEAVRREREEQWRLAPHAVVSDAFTKRRTRSRRSGQCKTKAAVLSKRLLKARFRLNAMRHFFGGRRATALS